MRLSIENLSCSYQSQTVVKDFNLLIGEGADDGEIICLFGKSGCGKSTVLKAVAGLIETDSGRIQVNGSVVNDEQHFVAPEKRRVGMIFQDYALFPHLTVLENVAFSLPKSQWAEAEELLQLVNLSDKSASYPHQLSGGQQQRVAIARALAAKPEVLLMDEPFSNIDHQIRYDLIREIRQILKQKKISTIFVTHNKAEAFAFADKIAVMREGAVAQCDVVETVYLQPADAEIGRLLGRLNILALSQVESALEQGSFEMNLPSLLMDKAAMLVRPQFLKPLKLEGDEIPGFKIEDSFTVGESSYLEVKFYDVPIILEKPILSDFSIGESIGILLLQHDYCFV